LNAVLQLTGVSCGEPRALFSESVGVHAASPLIPVTALDDLGAALKRSSVSNYWSSSGRGSPKRLIADALRKIGKDPARLRIGDSVALSSLDEFHCLGSAATDDLARLTGLGRGARVLDVGCGLGGPARRLASVFGCDVVGLDITSPFLEVASEITSSMGLDHRVEFVHADACQYAPQNEMFDVAWMQVAAANIDKRMALYRNVQRLLRTGGRFAIFDIFQSAGASLRYPVPWSDDGSTSALFSEPETVALLSAAGFRCVLHQDVSKRALDWFNSQWFDADLASYRIKPPDLGFSVLLSRWREITANQIYNLQSNAIRFGYLVAEKI
jgi:ubiquinone/menaquinone biosynthesis C-methylase UbiE